MLAAGRLRDRISIQRNAMVRSGAGYEAAWTDIATRIAAEVKPSTGGEAFRQGVERATQFYRITVRWREGIRPDDRVSWRGETLAIVGQPADPTGLREELLIVAESGVPT